MQSDLKVYNPIVESIAICIAAFIIITLTIYINPLWIYTNPYNPPWFDPFIYIGAFERATVAIERNPQYYPLSRIPFLAIGYFFHKIDDPVLANSAFKIFLSAVTSILVYGTTRVIYGRMAAYFAFLIILTSPMSLMALGWDYIDGSIMLFTSILYASCVFSVYSNNKDRYYFIFGATASMILVTYLGAAYLIISASIYFVLLLSSIGQLTVYNIFRSNIVSFFGFLAGYAILSFANYLMGGDLFIIRSQISAAIHYTAVDTTYSINNFGYLLWIGPWNSQWIGLFMSSILILLVNKYLRNEKNITAYESKIFLCAFYQLLSLVSIMILLTFKSVSVLSFWFYASFLIVPTSITVAALIKYIFVENNKFFNYNEFLVLLFVTFIMIISVSPDASNYIQNLMNIRTKTNVVFHIAFFYAAGLLLLFICKQLSYVNVGMLVFSFLFFVAQTSSMTLN